MKTFLSKEELGNDLLYDTLCALSRVFSLKGFDLVIVGASARDIAMKILEAGNLKWQRWMETAHRRS